MNDYQLIEALRSLGWNCARDEAGEVFCILGVDVAQVQILPTITRRADHWRISFMPSVSTKEFTAAAAFILDEDRSHVPIVARNFAPLRVTCLASSDIAVLSGDIVSWAMSQDLKHGLDEYRRLQTSSKGSLPLHHLAALAVTGDVERLSKYKDSFNRGDRLGFVPYISECMIDRALRWAGKGLGSALS